MGNDTTHLHQRHTNHIKAAFAKLKDTINNELIIKNIGFILDENYLKNFLIYMQMNLVLFLKDE